MTARHPDELIDAFLDEGRDDLPDRAFDAVRGEIHRTRQRVVIGPWREPHMSNLAKVALAAAAVVAVLFGASRLLPSTPGPGSTPPPPTPSPTVTPTDTAAPSAAFISPGPICDDLDASGPLEPGTYSVSNAVNTLVPYTVEVPAGWTLLGGCIIANGATDAESDVLFVTWNVSHIFPDACHWDESNVVPAGTTAAELTDLLRSQSGRVPSATTDVQVDGFAAKRTEFTVAPGIDPATCTGGPPGFLRFWPNAGPDFQSGFCCSPAGSTDDTRIADVNGQRVVVIIERSAAARPADVAAAEAIVDSIKFDTTSGASPTP
jgi:hypothetical protein